jgi:apolipoprotein N-acyltransferase
MVLAFPFTGSLTPLVFIAWIPLLIVESNIAHNNYRSGKVFIHAYITFFIYNIGTTWWVWYASETGALLAFLANTMLMAIVFYGFHLTKKYVGNKEGIIALVLYWIGFEYFHYDWASSWPWLSFGNVFSVTPTAIQWYSVTGVLGGTLWILILNLILFRIVENVYHRKENWRIQTPLFYSAGFLILIPVTTSLFMYYNYEEKGRSIEVVAVQPNLDPYTTKFESDPLDQLAEMLKQAEKSVTNNTQLVVGPETAYWDYIAEDFVESAAPYKQMVNAKPHLNNATLLFGVSSSRLFDKKETVTCTEIGKDQFVEGYNTSMMLDSIDAPKFIHKSKLVPGVEKVPFADVFPFMAEWSISLGGSKVGYGVEKHPKIFETAKFKFAPVICYESIFGGFVAEQCRQGAEFIAIITNDGWWKNTPGYKQHASFAQLRAIENRRSVVRSANTGTSCIINQRGDMTKETEWMVKDTIRADIKLNSEMTVYSSYGDVIGRSFGFVSIFLLLLTFVKRFKKLVGK